MSAIQEEKAIRRWMDFSEEYVENGVNARQIQALMETGLLDADAPLQIRQSLHLFL